MSRLRAYSGWQFFHAVNTSAVLGWAVFAGQYLVERGMSLAGKIPNPAGAVLESLLPAAIVGIPIALLCCWAVAAPILWRLMARPISWSRAAIWGIVVPGAMALVGLILARVQGLFAFLNPDFYFELGGGNYVREVDGILTPYGWWITIQNGVFFIAVGFVIALIVRAVIGPGRVYPARPGEKAETMAAE